MQCNKNPNKILKSFNMARDDHGTGGSVLLMAIKYIAIVTASSMFSISLCFSWIQKFVKGRGRGC